MQINNPQPIPGTETPLALLAACHDKVRHFAALTVKLQNHVATHGADEDASTAAQRILRYFNEAARLHHEDEEIDLFPALRALEDDKLNQDIDRLEAQHAELATLWQAVSRWLSAIAAGDAAAPPACLGQFANDYPAHARREEEDVFPAAARLSRDELDAISRAMVQRRGARP